MYIVIINKIQNDIFITNRLSFHVNISNNNNLNFKVIKCNEV